MAASSRLIALLGVLAAVFLATATSALAASYSNPTPIVVADDEPASPYPSVIGVAGLNGAIEDVNVTLRGVTHTCLDDLGVVVEGPGGQTLMLMNSVGPLEPCAEGSSGGVTNVDLTLDDEAATQLQDEVVPGTDAYRPANHQPGGTTLDPFDPPGPGSSYGNPGPALGGTATLASVFDGDEAKGTWKLWVRDFATGDDGEIARGWSLDVTTTGGGADTTAPDTQIDSGPGGATDQGSAQFTFSSNEPGSTFECALDSSPFAPCSSPKSYAGLAEGEHTFAVRAIDSAGNTDLTPATMSFTVDFPEPPPPPPPPSGGGADRQAPVVTITKLTVKRAKRSAKVTFGGSDNVTAPSALAFTCKLDAKPPRPCTSPAVFKRLKAGKHKVEVRATDAAGNQSAPAVKRFRVRKPAS